ncbi:MAG: right-handed parallel beta-helix repeat-containing protein, partial [Verrucomicrobia bacterium]|nr:right-handed parallel beta-helix repeat-containing protein [Verrucomicrobiota bacterium]
MAIALAGLSAKADSTFYVAPNGSDANPGTRGRPFRSFERARAAVRDAGQDNARKVIVRGGVYEFSATFSLGALDSGTTTHPVIWEAAKGESVRLEGGRKLPASVWQPVEDSTVSQRLDPVARSKVRKVDLKALGISTSPFPIAYHGAPPGPELFCGDQRMKLACWPNQGWATIARIIESGSRPRDGDQKGRLGAFEYSSDRPSSWRATDGVWLQGYWCYDWYDEVIRVASVDPATHRITLAAPHVYSLMQGNPSPRRYRALNVLEELDQPGEFVINAVAGVVYFWPPGDPPGPVTVSTLDAPIMALKEASHIVLRGFVVECGLGDGIEVSGGTNCSIQTCTARNLRRTGIRVDGGFAHRVCDCDIYDTGTGGLALTGGDRKTLSPGRHEALNNHIWRFSQHQFTSAYGLSFGGVGCRAAHNLIHDAPHQAIFVGGNDHV